MQNGHVIDKMSNEERKECMTVGKDKGTNPVTCLLDGK
jgi:hypothetical protein